MPFSTEAPVPDQGRGVQRLDVIQIAPVEKVREDFRGKLAVVDEVRAWGVQANVHLFGGFAPVRLEWDSFVRIGTLQWVDADTYPPEEEGS